MRVSKFTVTPEHVRLMRRMIVSWESAEYGAPCIDPKRPYGNSGVAEDIREILGLPDLTDESCERLHAETETALQIALAVGHFTPGKYECDWPRRNWRMREVE